MRRHLELGLTLGAALAFSTFGVGCSRSSDQSANYPVAEPVHASTDSYSEVKKTSTPPTMSQAKAEGFDGMEKSEGAPMPPKSTSSSMDNGAYDRFGAPNTGSMDNVPSGIGGGPMDKGGGDDTIGDAADGNAPKAKGTTLKGPSKGTNSTNANGKPAAGKSATTGTGNTGPTGSTSGTGAAPGGAGAGAAGGGAGGK